MSDSLYLRWSSSLGTSLEHLRPSCKQEFHDVLCHFMWPTWTTVLGYLVSLSSAPVLHPLGQWRGHKLCLLANGLFQVRDLEIWKGGICVRDWGNWHSFIFFLEFYMHKDDTIAPEIRVRDLHVRPCQAIGAQPDFQLTGQRRVARDLAAGGDTPLSCTWFGAEIGHIYCLGPALDGWTRNIVLDDSVNVRPAHFGGSESPAQIHLVNRMVGMVNSDPSHVGTSLQCMTALSWHRRQFCSLALTCVAQNMTNISSAGCFSSQIMAQNAAMNFWQAYILLILFRTWRFFWP